MKAKGFKGFYRFGVIVLSLLVFSSTGCFESAGELDRNDGQHPLLKKASDRLRARDTDKAVQLYLEALHANPTLARAHLELGLIYDEHKEDYIRAIYHYQRYLEMRPETEKRQLIEDAVRHSRMAYAASLPQRPSEAIEVIAQLKNENRVLRQRNQELMGRLEEKISAAADNPYVPTLSAEDPVLRAQRPDPTPPVEVAVSPSKVTHYTVKANDTLISISKKVYGTSKRWKDIYQANRGEIGSTYRLKIGQRLNIPRE